MLSSILQKKKAKEQENTLDNLFSSKAPEFVEYAPEIEVVNSLNIFEKE